MMKIQSGDVDHLQTALQDSLGWPINLSKANPEKLNASINLVKSPRFSFSNAEFSSDITMKRTDDRPDNLSILLIRQGSYEIEKAGKTNFSSGPVALLDIRKAEYLSFDGKSSSLYATLSKSHIFSSIYRINRTEVEFDTQATDVMRPGDYFTDLIRKSFFMFFECTQLADADKINQISVNLAEDFCLSLLAEYMIKKSKSEERYSRSILPRTSLARIVEYCEVSDTPLRVTEIADIFDISVRTLENSFVRELGMTPHAYLKRMRLAAFRRDLITKGNERLMDLAKYWAFSNITRLKCDYISTFGIDDWRRLTGRI